MKKVLFLVFSIIILSACNYKVNEPRKEVENLFNKYNYLDDLVLRNLDLEIVNNNIEEDNYKLVRSVFKRQYKDLKYKIINVTKISDIVYIKAKINVYNFKRIKKKEEKYINENIEKFMILNEIDNYKIEKYLYNKLLKTNKRKNYIINFKLVKNNNKWIIKNNENEIISKINGTY